MKIGIIDYGVGNLRSVTNALRTLSCASFISSDPTKLNSANALILPGDGAAKEGMKNLQKSKLDVFVKDQLQKGKPFFGICLGMQVLMDWSEEGNTKCLGIIKGKVKKIKTNNKLPQIGWNTIKSQKSKVKSQSYNSKFKSLLYGISDNSYFYFINSYICDPDDQVIISGTTKYGEEFCSVFEKDNIYAVQFHPEKSGETGLQMLKNFLKTI